MTLLDYCFPPSRCAVCDVPLRVVWVTVCDVAVCLSCGTKQWVVERIVQEAKP
jgi:hypothetical protein